MAERKKRQKEEEPPRVMPELGLQEALISEEKEETEMDKVLKLLLDPANIAHNTELSRNEITAFSVLSTMRQKHKLPVLNAFLKDNLEYRVSKNRAGRKEWVKITSRQLAMSDQQDEMQTRGRFGRLWGRR